MYQQRNYEAALSAYQSLISQYPGLAQAYNGAGWSYYQLTRDNEALVAFQTAINLDPNYEGVIMTLRDTTKNESGGGTPPKSPGLRRYFQE